MKATYTYDAAGNVTATKTQSSSGSGIYQQSTATYDGTMNYVLSQTDVNGAQVKNTYNTNKGLLEKTEDPRNIVTEYEYDANNDRLTSVSRDETASVEYQYDSRGLLSHIVRESLAGSNPLRQSYDFIYNDLGLTTEIRVSSDSQGQTLASYVYDNSKRLSRMNYPNGDYVVYGYDIYDRVITETYYNSSGQQQSQNCYVYSSQGDLAKQYVVKNGAVTEAYSFEYDSLGRLIRSLEESSTSLVQRTEHLYDSANRLSKQTWSIGDRSYAQEYTYSTTDGTLTKATTGIGLTMHYTYDTLKRLTKVTSKNSNGEMFTTEQTYLASGDKTTNRIGTYVFTRSSGERFADFTYAYDAAGNITSVTSKDEAGSLEHSAQYVYDNHNQLTQETYTYANNGAQTSATVNYTYDTAGNLLSSTGGTANVTYTYGDANWKDLLTSIQVGSTTKNISYVGGNPTNWYNGTEYTGLTWTQGRRLSSITKGSSTYTYDYDMDGIRSSKTVDGAVHNYVTLNGKVVQESCGNTVKVFTYDTTGNPYAMQVSTDGGQTFTKYYYVLNAQGDVVHVLSWDRQICATYIYNAWGKILSASGTAADLNPLRYRGYYYDYETGFYYLQSRYYDPEIGRFLNVDAIDILGIQNDSLDFNLYAYCNNDPVNHTDPSGYFAIAMTFKAVYYVYNVVLGLGVTVMMGEHICRVVSNKNLSRYKYTVHLAKQSKEKKKSKKASKKSGKESANDAPGWAKRENYDKSKTADQNATDVLNKKYGKGKWKKGADSEFSKIKKWLQRSKNYK